MKLVAKVNEEGSKTSKFQWVFFVLIIPILFSFLLFFIILTLGGVNIGKESKEIMKNIPFLEKYADDNRKEKLINNLQKQQERLELQLQDKLEYEKKLKQDGIRKDQQISSLQAEIKSLKLKSSKGETELKGNVIVTFTEMKPKNASKILSEMPIDDAYRVLIKLPSNTAASILENMDASVAAQLTKRMSYIN